MLHSKTRVVKTYGKQRQRVVNVHQDWKDLQAEDAAQRTRSEQSILTTTVSLSSPSKASRPILASKPSQARITEAHDDGWEDAKAGEPRKAQTGSKKVEVIVEVNKSKPEAARTTKAAPRPKKASSAAARRPVRDSVVTPSPTAVTFADSVNQNSDGAAEPRKTRQQDASTSSVSLGQLMDPRSSPLTELPTAYARDSSDSSAISDALPPRRSRALGKKAMIVSDDTSSLIPSVPSSSPLNQLMTTLAIDSTNPSTSSPVAPRRSKSPRKKAAQVLSDDTSDDVALSSTAQAAADPSDSSGMFDPLPPRRNKTTRKNGGKALTRAQRRVSSPQADSDRSGAAFQADEQLLQSSSKSGAYGAEQDGQAGIDSLTGKLGGLKVSTSPGVTRARRGRTHASFEVIKTRDHAVPAVQSANAEPADALSALLSLGQQEAPQDFATFLAAHDFCSLAGKRTTRGNRKASPPVEYNIVKVGEASFSEVYAVSRADGEGERIIAKVIPLQNTSDTQHKPTLREVEDDEEIALSEPLDVAREVRISQIMTGMGSGFVEFKSVHVVRGAYPARLLEAWDVYEEDYGTQSSRPASLPEDQLYAIILLGDGGVDLEHFKFGKSSGWRQAHGVWWQVVYAIAQAEERGQFEHRDLHEGQILIRTLETQQDFEAAPSDPAYCGLHVTVADFGLSRVNDPTGGLPIWTPIPEDVYEGVGEQWDVYRRMRDFIESADGADWSAWYPQTNVMWLHRLLRAILFSTESLRKPKSTAVLAALAKRDPTRSPVRQRHVRACSVARDVPEVSEDEVEERACYASLMDLEQRLRVAAGFEDASKKGRGRSKASDSLEVKSATALMAWAEATGYL